MYAGEMCYWYWELDRGGGELLQGQPGAAPMGDAGERGMVADAGTGMGSESKCGSSAGYVSGSGGESASGPATPGSRPSPFGLMGAMRGLDFVREWREGFSPARLGVEYLSKYIDAARGPLKLQQWSYDRAIQLLVRLKKSLQ